MTPEIKKGQVKPWLQHSPLGQAVFKAFWHGVGWALAIGFVLGLIVGALWL